MRLHRILHLLCTSLSPQRALLSRRARQPEKQLLNRIGPRVNTAHRRLDVIVAGRVLQREGVSVLAGLSKKSVPQSVQPTLGWALIFFPVQCVLILGPLDSHAGRFFRWKNSSLYGSALCEVTEVTAKQDL